MQRQNIHIHHGSENIFADLGFPDADTHLLKAQLVNRLSGLIETLGLTQTQLAQQTGVSQPDISRILKGRFRDISVERIIRMLSRLGCEIDILIKSANDTAPAPAIRYQANPA